MRHSLVGILLLALLAGCGKQAVRAPEASFAALSGEKLAMSELRGKVVLVNFWATECLSCAKELPRMIEAYRKFSPRGYEVVAVAMSYDRPQAVAEYARRRYMGEPDWAEFHEAVERALAS